MDEKKCGDAVVKLVKAISAYQKAAEQSGTPPDEITEATTSPAETVALANATMIEHALGTALVADDDDTREDCRGAVTSMIKEAIPETAIHARLLSLARHQISQR